jgi:hypothetical protein
LHEGAHSNDKDDLGGDTKWAIAWVMHPEISKEKWVVWTKNDSIALLKKMYWDALGCNDLPSGFDAAVFDCAVNPGPGACHHMLSGCFDFKCFNERRRQYYRDRVAKCPKDKKYINGWLKRVDDVEKVFGGGVK